MDDGILDVPMRKKSPNSRYSSKHSSFVNKKPVNSAVSASFGHDESESDRGSTHGLYQGGQGESQNKFFSLSGANAHEYIPPNEAEDMDL